MAGRWQKAILVALGNQVRRYAADVTRPASVVLAEVVADELGVDVGSVPEKSLSAARRAAHSLVKAGIVSLSRSWVGGQAGGQRLEVGLAGQVEDERVAGLRARALAEVVAVLEAVAAGELEAGLLRGHVERSALGFVLPAAGVPARWLRQHVRRRLARLGVRADTGAVRKAVDRAVLDAEERGLVTVHRGYRRARAGGWTSRPEALFVVLSDAVGTTLQSGQESGVVAGHGIG